MDINILLISGSPSKDSHTLVLLNFLEKLLNKEKVKTTIWDLQKRSLPVVIPEYHDDPITNPNKDVQEFIKLVEKSDGVILGTPLYHGSFSGTLKNALDNLGGDALKNKYVGLVSNSGGVANMQACEHLRSVVRTLYGYTLQTQIGTSDDDYKEINSSLTLSNNSIKLRSNRFIKELLFLTSLFKQASSTNTRDSYISI